MKKRRISGPRAVRQKCIVPGLFCPNVWARREMKRPEKSRAKKKGRSTPQHVRAMRGLLRASKAPLRLASQPAGPEANTAPVRQFLSRVSPLSPSSGDFRFHSQSSGSRAARTFRRNPIIIQFILYRGRRLVFIFPITAHFRAVQSAAQVFAELDTWRWDLVRIMLCDDIVEQFCRVSVPVSGQVR